MVFYFACVLNRFFLSLFIILMCCEKNFIKKNGIIYVRYLSVRFKTVAGFKNLVSVLNIYHFKRCDEENCLYFFFFFEWVVFDL